VICLEVFMGDAGGLHFEYYEIR